ncbi:GNAT family N-acetyltransferase [Devosia sp.]|uniref:GNAT family N-acetyltransferase n=1 Tax=Devosia sp. TaxID=1871048 RepID=UPI00326669BF
MPLSDYVITSGIPGQEEFRALRVAAGLSPKTQAAAEAGLPNTVFAVMIRHENQLIGMGRIIGDGGMAFQITDIAVRPEHQGRGLGKAIVGRLVAYLRENAPKSAYVSLIADGAAQHLYAKFGFEPVTPEAIGMAFRVE